MSVNENQANRENARQTHSLNDRADDCGFCLWILFTTDANKTVNICYLIHMKKVAKTMNVKRSGEFTMALLLDV